MPLSHLISAATLVYKTSAVDKHSIYYLHRVHLVTLKTILKYIYWIDVLYNSNFVQAIWYVIDNGKFIKLQNDDEDICHKFNI